MKLERKILYVTAGIVLAAVLAGYTLLQDQENATATFKVEGEPELQLEVADTAEERSRGLMYRKQLENGTGMIFLFPEEKKHGFWMKNTYIPLDIIFINSSGAVVDIERAHPEPDTPEENLTIYRSDRPAKYVIETRRGFSRLKGIKPGTAVSLELPDSPATN